MLKPVTPAAPTSENIHPPTIAPTMPSTRSRMRPSPVLLTILLPRNPATMPRTIQATNDIRSSLTVRNFPARSIGLRAHAIHAGRRYAGSDPGPSRAVAARCQATRRDLGWNVLRIGDIRAPGLTPRPIDGGSVLSTRLRLVVTCLLLAGPDL